MSEYRDTVERYLDAGYSRHQAEREAAIDGLGYRPKRRRPWIDSRDPAYNDTADNEESDET